jgi:hypothetical protein
LPQNKGNSRLKVKFKNQYSWQNRSRSPATIHAAIVSHKAYKNTIAQKNMILNYSIIIFLVLFFSSFITRAQQVEKFKPDESISGIYFYNPNSTIEKIPQIDQYWNSITDTSDTMPNIKFYNRDSSEILTLFIHYGSYKYDFAEFNISQANWRNAETIIYYLPDKYFITESGIRLGISLEDLKGIKGDVFVHRSYYNIDTLSYKINDFNTKFLLKYHMPEYYAYYVFYNKKLIEFGFGFTYP